MGRGHNIVEEMSLKNDLMLFVFAKFNGIRDTVSAFMGRVVCGYSYRTLNRRRKNLPETDNYLMKMYRSSRKFLPGQAKISVC